MLEMKLPPCGVCRQQVPLAQGRLLLKEDDVARYSNQGIEMEEEPILWHWGHEQCLENSRHVIISKRFDNIGQLLDWMAELLTDRHFHDRLVSSQTHVSA
ncbi:hypothetical protein ACFLX9_02940 [Chloroflexota bacterium]